MTANTLVQGQGVKGQGHSVCNRQRRLTAKSVRISCLFNVEKWAWHHVLCMGGCQAELLKTSENAIFSIKNPENPENADNTPCRSTGKKLMAFEVQCFHNCRLSSFNICWISADADAYTVATEIY